MAIYQYTLRADTKVVDGIEIGRYGYAYKESSSLRKFPGSSATAAIESKGEDAAHRHRHVRHFIMADSFKTAADDSYAVIEIDREPSAVRSGFGMEPKIVGYLKRSGRNYYLTSMSSLKAA